MRINNIKATNMELTEAIQGYVEKKLSLLDKLVQNEGEAVFANVEIGKTTMHHHNGDVFVAEVNIHTPGKDFRAVSNTEDLYAAIDMVKDELAREMTSHKDKKRVLVKKGGLAIKNMLRGGIDKFKKFRK